MRWKVKQEVQAWKERKENRAVDTMILDMVDLDTLDSRDLL